MKNIKKNTHKIFFDVILGTDDLHVCNSIHFQCSEGERIPVERASLEVFDRMKIVLTQS